MTVVARTTQPVQLLEPMIGFQDNRRFEPVQRMYAGLTAGDLLLADTRFPKQYRELADAGTPLPEKGYYVATLRGGAQSYIGSVGRPNRHAPWWNRLTSTSRQCFAVWGRPAAGQRGPLVYDPNRTARTSNGRGVVYSRWPIFSDNGDLERYGARVTQVEFHLRTRNSKLAPTLVVETSHSRYFTDGPTEEPELYLDGIDAHWYELITRAKAGFDKECSAKLPHDVEQWRQWLLEQRAKAETDRRLYGDGFHARVGGLGWLAALDSVMEAWQLAAALMAHRHLFPEVPPDASIELTPKLLEQPVPDIVAASLATMPRYEGTTGGMEGRLLEAYYRLRPERREKFERWMDDYASLISNLRNYTGD